MNYHYLKIGPGNESAEEWLSGDNPLQRPAAVVFFDAHTRDEYQAGMGGKDARRFWECGKSKERANNLFVVVKSGKLWILKPEGEVQFLPKVDNGMGGEHTPKAMPVEVHAFDVVRDNVPYVLASIGVNQRYNRGTFRPIDHWGNMKAIDILLKRPLKDEHWISENNQSAQLLECLGSEPLETLIAKLLEAHGCFVPAYRGGLLQGIDLFAHNDTSQDIVVKGLCVPAKQRVSIQVKMWADERQWDQGVDYFISLNSQNTDRTKNSEWILDSVKEVPSVKDWMLRSLSWLPDSFLSGYF